jgi:hypothetical protein
LSLSENGKVLVQQRCKRELEVKDFLPESNLKLPDKIPKA